MAEEIRLHIEWETERQIAAGIPPEEARYAALRQFGGIEQIKEIARDQRPAAWIGQLLRDLRLAARSLMRSPGFTATTILILALGIGGGTAVFSTLYTVMIRPLPYPEPDRLVLGRATYEGVINPMVSGPDFVDYREQAGSFAALGAFMARPHEVSVTRGRRTERVASIRVTAGLLEALGVAPAIGRAFAPSEGNNTGAPVAIISHSYWKNNYEPTEELSGMTIVVDGTARAVVGVLPAGFHFIQDADVWLPRTGPDLGPRRYNNWLIIGRLKPGVSLVDAQSDVDMIAARLEQAYPDTNRRKGLLLTPLQGAFTEHYRLGFLLLCGGAASILLIACANAAGLLLARGAGRQGELAIRAALGASQAQIMRLLLTESILLAATAAMLGTVVAMWVQALLMRLFSVEMLFVQESGLSQCR